MSRASAETSKPSQRRSLLAIVFAVLGALLVAAAAALVAYNVTYANGAGQRAEMALSALEDQLPPFALEDYRAPSGNLAAAQVEGVSYVGILELPTLAVRLPVLAQALAADLPDADFAPYLHSYDVESGDIVIGGANYAYQLGDIGKLAAGDVVRFTDMGGHERAFEVATLATVDSSDDAELAQTCADSQLSLFANTFSGMQRTVVCCRSALAG